MRNYYSHSLISILEYVIFDSGPIIVRRNIGND